MANYPEGQFACVMCGHDVAHHNQDAGCPYCKCLAAPSEASYNPLVASPWKGQILPPTAYRDGFNRPQRPTPTPEVKGRFRIFEWVSGVRHEAPESPKPTLAEAQNYVARIDPAGRRVFEIIAPVRKPRLVTKEEVEVALNAYWGTPGNAKRYGTYPGMRAALEAVEEFRA